MTYLGSRDPGFFLFKKWRQPTRPFTSPCHLKRNSNPVQADDQDEEEEETVEEEDLWCKQAMDDFERQRTFQTQLLEQSGGGIDPETPIGTFEFDLQPYVNRTSDRMGVHERHFTTR